MPLSEWQEVATPPPTVEVEEINKVQQGYVWLDGQWMYQPLTKRWLWEQGRWCMEPPGTLFYAFPEIRRERRVQQEGGTPLQTVRWSVLRQRYEQVDVYVDRWRWLPGAFYVGGPEGRPVRWAGQLSCILPEKGL